jgi:glucosylglycerol-phosphate synthase
VLSEFTGASVVLDGAILTNPYSHRQMDQAIERALEMPEDEQIIRMSRMSHAVESFTVSDWVSEQMDALEEKNDD